MPGIFETYAPYTTPVVVIRVNGSSSADLSARVTELKYQDNHHIGGKKKGTNVDKLELHISDPLHEFTSDPRFNVDSRWDVRWGYPTNMSDVRWFLLKYYEPVYEPNGFHAKKLTLYGAAYTLTTVRGARNWGRVSSSDIVRQIAKRHGIKNLLVDESADQTDTPYVQPAGVSDFEYLNELAGDIDFEFFVENDTLVYRSRDSAYQATPRARLIYGAPNSLLLSFKPTVKATHDVTVAAKGVDTKSAEAVQPKVNSDNVGGAFLGDETVKTLNDTAHALTSLKKHEHQEIHSKDEAIAKIDQLKRDHDVDHLTGKIKQTAVDLENGTITTVTVPDSTSAVVHTPETNPQKVGKVAKAVKRDFMAATVEAHAECIGDPIFRAKSNFNIVLPDPRLTGPWYSEEATHTINDKGYRVTMKLHRGALTSDRATAAGKNNRTDVGRKGESPNAPQPTVTVNLETGEVSPTTPSPGTR